MRARVLALALAVAGVAAAARASADDPRASAAGAYDKGSETFAHREYAAAADWFELADTLAPEPHALEGAIKAHRKIGSPADLARAATLALRLKERSPADAEAVRFADEALATLAPIFGRLTVHCAGCELSVDGAAVDARDLFLPPGAHRLAARWPERGAEGRPLEESRGVHTASGAHETLEWARPPVAPAPAPAAPVPPPALPTAHVAPAAAPSSGVSPAYAFTGLALTAALGAGAALIWFAKAVPDGNQLTAEAQATHRPDSSLQSRVDGETHLVVALDVATGVVGAATLVTALFFTRWRGEAPSSAVGFAPLPGGGGVASFGARF